MYFSYAHRFFIHCKMVKLKKKYNKYRVGTTLADGKAFNKCLEDATQEELDQLVHILDKKYFTVSKMPKKPVLDKDKENDIPTL